jgi:hypothetical protein
MAVHEIRSSRSLAGLKRELAQCDVTEEEFVALLDMQRVFDDRFTIFRGNGGLSWEPTAPGFQEAKKEMEQQAKGLLGPERFEAYQLSRDREFDQLTQRVRRAGLPASAAREAFEIREAASVESFRIKEAAAADDEKLAALRALADQSREKLSSLLGPEVASLQIDRSSWWLDALESGRGFRSEAHMRTTTRIVQPRAVPGVGP